MNKVNLAPIIIPTLCRYEHFKQCIESLSNCTWANRTEVYVGLDYPAKESHWDGYNKIKTYLSSCGNLNFKKLNVIERPYNYGFGPNGNFATLKKTVFEISDRIIVTEDDNVFSPNFLMYINKGLELYEGDMTVQAICGYSHPIDFYSNKNNSFRQNINYSAWGYGIWKHKDLEFSSLLNKKTFRRILYSPKMFWKVYKTGYHRLLNVIVASSQDKYIPKTDYYLSILTLITGRTIIMPVKSMVRNMGWDETATNTNIRNDKDKSRSLIELNRKIDVDNTFEFKGDNWFGFEENNKRLIAYGQKYTTVGLKFKSIVWCKYIIRIIQFWK